MMRCLKTQNSSTNHKSLDWQCPHIQYPWPIGPPFSWSLRDCLSGKGPKSTSQQGNKMDTGLVFLDVSHPESCDTLCLDNGLSGIGETTQNSTSENTEKQQHSLKHTLCSVPCELINSTCCAFKKKEQPKVESGTFSVPSIPGGMVHESGFTSSLKKQEVGAGGMESLGRDSINPHPWKSSDVFGNVK